MTAGLVLALIGALSGLVMGVIGVGGGAILMFSLLTFTALTPGVARGTTLLVVAAPVSVLAALNYARNGLVDWRAAGLVTVCFVIFSLLGSHLGLQLPDVWLKRGLGVVLVLMGTRTLLTAL